MSNHSEKRAYFVFVMTIVQTFCSIVMTLIAVGALIGRYFHSH